MSNITNSYLSISTTNSHNLANQTITFGCDEEGKINALRTKINEPTLNTCGRIPIISTFTGIGRILLALVHTVINLAQSIFDASNKNEHLNNAKIGGQNIARGLVEMIPIAGNCFIKAYDDIKMAELKKSAEAYIEKNPDEFKDQTVNFSYNIVDKETYVADEDEGDKIKLNLGEDDSKKENIDFSCWKA